MSSVPEAPVNVRIQHPSGEVTVLENIFKQKDPDGTNVWAPVHPYTFGDGDTVEADVIPAKTRIELERSGV